MAKKKSTCLGVKDTYLVPASELLRLTASDNMNYLNYDNIILSITILNQLPSIGIS